MCAARRGVLIERDLEASGRLQASKPLSPAELRQRIRSDLNGSGTWYSLSVVHSRL